MKLKNRPLPVCVLVSVSFFRFRSFGNATDFHETWHKFGDPLGPTSLKISARSFSACSAMAVHVSQYQTSKQEGSDSH